jgi:hypothetical protein
MMQMIFFIIRIENSDKRTPLVIYPGVKAGIILISCKSKTFDVIGNCIRYRLALLIFALKTGM